MVSREHWEKEASNWAAWARTPDFDSYWKYAPSFFELVPPPRGQTLEVGCGEGRVSRDLAARGHRVVAVDASPTLIRLAHDADGSVAYARCDAAALPFPHEAFALVVFYNSLMDFDDMEGSVSEAARVLQPGGHMCVCVTHPLTDAGSFSPDDPNARFVIEGSYLGPRRWFNGSAEKDGLTMSFAGWAYPLEAYSRALERAGFRIEAIREPSGSEERWRRIPMFLMWRAVKA